ncbi:MAG: cysteine peptidase family C39 domain-containing protein [Candidatus Azambacteria bacterium]|nr:cysteine peptidase family C39 domain-containing protein [Candidatus Azambacteria bacterium]
MLNIKPYKQTRGMCGPASLKMALEYFGVEKSEKELARLINCNPDMGAKAEDIVSAAKKLGFNAQIKDLANFEDIKEYLSQEIPVIVDWFSEDDGHYSVAVDIDEKNIYLQDPEIGGIRELPLETFKRVWFDFPGAFINSKDELILRRIIVIKK